MEDKEFEDYCDSLIDKSLAKLASDALTETPPPELSKLYTAKTNVFNDVNNEADGISERLTARDGKVFASYSLRRMYDWADCKEAKLLYVLRNSLKLRIPAGKSIYDFVPYGVGESSLRFFLSSQVKKLKNKYFCLQFKRYQSLLKTLGIEADMEDCSFHEFIQERGVSSWIDSAEEC